MTEANSLSEAIKLGKKLHYLPYIIKRYINLIGDEETIHLLEFNEKKLPDVIRLNSLREEPKETEKLLRNKGVKMGKLNELPEARQILSSPVPIGATPEYLNGYYMLQGKNSLYPARLLNPKKDEVVGDFAAAPGGKTSHLAQLMNNKGKIIALEISSNRCRSLKSNLARMGVENTIVIQMDSRKVEKLPIEFDKILLDAPCSGSGIIVSDPTRKFSKSLDDIKKYQHYQEQLLEKAFKVLKSGGELVYCTCSLEPEENEAVISKMIDSGEISLAELDIEGENGVTNFEKQKFNEEVRKARRLYPHKSKGEGFFIAKMVMEK